jgi:hypothetical protein
MPTLTWWIDEPLLKASSNPSDDELAQFRAQDFSVLVSFLEESKQAPRYDRKSAALAGWFTRFQLRKVVFLRSIKCASSRRG